MIAVSCAPASKSVPAMVRPPAETSAAAPLPIRFQFIYVVHGDAGLYLVRCRRQAA